MQRIQSTVDAVTLKYPWLFHVTHDLYDIAKRIRDIDSGYFIVRNRLSGKYEVHHIETYPRTYQFTVPYPSLDARTLDYCEKTLVQNSEKVIQELEKHNEKIDQDARKDRHNVVEGVAVDLANDLRRAI